MKKVDPPRFSDNPKYPLKRIWAKPQGPPPPWISPHFPSPLCVYVSKGELKMSNFEC
jgi:hypothetical protein